MTCKGRLYYVGMINTQAYCETLGYELFMGAANRKMLSVLRAARSIGASAWLVSIPVIGKVAQELLVPHKVLRDQGGPVLFLPTSSNRYVRTMLATLCLVHFCFFRVRRDDRVIFYNYAFEYIPSMVLLRLLARPGYLDIEDAPRGDVRGYRASFGRILFNSAMKLTHRRKIVVSKQVAGELGIDDALVIHGVTEVSGFSEHAPFERSGPVRVLYGGTLNAETGLSLFVEGVEVLTKVLPDAPTVLTFVITGTGGDVELRRLVANCANGPVTIDDRRNVGQRTYFDLLRGCDVALSLKLPTSTISSTTFPSKVVEITNEGLLLVTTSVSDIPTLFAEDQVVILESATAEDFAKLMINIVGNRPAMAKIAKRGQQQARNLFSASSVGMRLLRHVEMAASQSGCR